MARSIPLATAVVLLVLAASCSDSSTSETTTETTVVSTTTTETTAPPDDAATAPVPASPEAAAAFVLELLNGSSLTEAEFEATFTPFFRDAIGFDDLTTLFAQVAAEGPWTLGAVRSSDAGSARYEITSSSGEMVFLDVTVDDVGIAGLFLSPAQEFEPPDTVEDAINRLEALGRLRMAVTDASNGACAPVVDAGLREIMPLGSAFKLYVLGAVVKAMDDGSIGWDTEVEIRDELDSLPSGTTQDVEPGTTLTVRELADAMISVSDNTATDHLIDLVGREAVEAVLVPMGNDAIERNRPFLTTRELFVLKFGDPALGERYVVADEAERRSILLEVADAPLPDVAQADPRQPVRVEELEWFASPLALCDAMVWLVADATALEVLSANPGVPATTDVWQNLAFKGGSEPGLLAMVWWTATEDGRAFVTAGSVTSSSGPVDEFEAVNLFAFVRDRGPGLDEVGESD